MSIIVIFCKIVLCVYYIRCVARFGTICTIQKTPMKECYFLACNFTKSNSAPWVFFTFLNGINGTKSRKASRIHKYPYIYKSINLSISASLYICVVLI